LTLIITTRTLVLLDVREYVVCNFLALFLPIHGRCRDCCTWSHSTTHTYSVGLLCTRDRPVAKTSTRQNTTLVTDIHLCLRCDSNPQSQQASVRRPTPWATGIGPVSDSHGIKYTKTKFLILLDISIIKLRGRINPSSSQVLAYKIFGTVVS
jgi:hypothetical protein